VRVERFDPRADEQRLRACHEMTVAGHQTDDPNVPAVLFNAFRGWWGHGFAGSPVQAWLATDESGEPAGGYLLELPDQENRQSAFGFVVVPPARRRRGLGTELLAHMARQSDRAGRKLLMSSARVGAPAEAFEAATGGRPGMRDVRRILAVDDGLRRRLPGLRASAEPRAAGYTLRSWQGTTPDDLAAGICATYTALGDAPHDESFEPATWDEPRLRKSEERLVAQRTRWHSVAAIADGAAEVAGSGPEIAGSRPEVAGSGPEIAGSGPEIAGSGPEIAGSTAEVAAITQVVVEPLMPEWGWQEITAVTRPHRGHRLGLLVKVAMHELLTELEPQLRYMATYNAEPNERMIAVNELLGYRVSDYFRSWEHDVAAASALACGL
jgi:GNAT superfamily N-acetyltransferase